MLQAERLRLRWSEAPDVLPDVLISSHYPRARQTAQAIAAAFGDMPIMEDVGFGEHDPGEQCDGMAYADFMETHGVDGSQWHTMDPFDVTFPGGETVAAFHYRVGEALKRTVTNHPDHTVVVACHGGVVDAVLRKALRAPSLGGFEVHTLNTSITELETVNNSTWRLIRYNDVAHLAGLPASTPADGGG